MNPFTDIFSNMMMWGLKYAFYIWIVVIVIFVIIYFITPKRRYADYDERKYKEKTKKDIYKSKPPFTNSELAFFKQLNKHLKDKEVFVLSKLRIADFVSLKEYMSKYDYRRYFSQIAQKHVDFIIVDNYWKILVLIELDWNSHDTEKTIKSDIFKNDLFIELWLPFERFNYSKDYYNFSKLDKYINK